MDASEQRHYLSNVPGGMSFDEKLEHPLVARDIEILQLNIGEFLVMLIVLKTDSPNARQVRGCP